MSDPKSTYDYLKSRIDYYAQKLGLETHEFPSYENAFGEGYNLVIGPSGILYLEEWERGTMYNAEVATDIEDLCYRFFKTRIDSRVGYLPDQTGTPAERLRDLHRRREEMMGLLNSEWQAKFKNDNYWYARRWGFEQ